MKISATQQIEIQIDNEQRHRICLDYLYEKFDWSPDYRISGDRVICRTTAHTSHSFDYDVDIRLATDLDRTISLIVERLISKRISELRCEGCGGKIISRLCTCGKAHPYWNKTAHTGE